MKCNKLWIVIICYNNISYTITADMYLKCNNRSSIISTRTCTSHIVQLYISLAARYFLTFQHTFMLNKVKTPIFWSWITLVTFSKVSYFFGNIFHNWCTVTRCRHYSRNCVLFLLFWWLVYQWQVMFQKTITIHILFSMHEPSELKTIVPNRVLVQDKIQHIDHK